MDEFDDTVEKIREKFIKDAVERMRDQTIAEDVLESDHYTSACERHGLQVYITPNDTLIVEDCNKDAYYYYLYQPKPTHIPRFHPDGSTEVVREFHTNMKDFDVEDADIHYE